MCVSIDDGSIPEIKGEKGSPINNIIFTKNGIVKLLKELDPAKSSATDGISARILKECANEIADSIVLIFTASLQQGKIPDEWKHAIITRVNGLTSIQIKSVFLIGLERSKIICISRY